MYGESNVRFFMSANRQAKAPRPGDGGAPPEATAAGGFAVQRKTYSGIGGGAPWQIPFVLAPALAALLLLAGGIACIFNTQIKGLCANAWRSDWFCS